MNSWATPKGGRITVTAESLDGQVVIAVADTGVGIPDASASGWTRGRVG